MKYLIIMLLSFSALADQSIELTGDLDVTGTTQTASTVITYDQEGNAVQICMGLTLNGVTPPVGGGDPIDVQVYSYDTASTPYNDTDFSGQAGGLINSVNGADLTLNTEGGYGGRLGLNVFVTSLAQTIDSAKTYKLKFTRGGEDTVDANNTDLTNNKINISRGFSFGFVFDKTHDQVDLIYNVNSSGYTIDTTGDNILATAKLTRLVANLGKTGLGYVASSIDADDDESTGYTPTSDLTDGDIELWLVPGATFYTMHLYANGNLVNSLATTIPITSTSILPYFHLNNWSSTSQYSIETLTGITLEVL